MWKIKRIVIILSAIIILILLFGITFFIIDYNRAKEDLAPIFVIKTGALLDGGTVEYLGLGYRVIDYHKLNGYDETVIGTLFLKYDETASAKEAIVTDEMLNKVQQYICNEYENRNRESGEAIKAFAVCENLGAYENEDIIELYVVADCMLYYKNDGKVYSGEGGKSPYKFTLSNDNKKNIIKCETYPCGIFDKDLQHKYFPATVINAERVHNNNEKNGEKAKTIKQMAKDYFNVDKIEGQQDEDIAIIDLPINPIVNEPILVMN